MAAGGDDYELARVRAQAVADGGGVGGVGNALAPEFCAAFGVEGAEELIGGGADEDQAAGRRQRAAQVGRAVVKPQRPGRLIPGGAQRHLPALAAAFQIHRAESAPGRRHAGRAKIRQQRSAAHGIGRAAHGVELFGIGGGFEIQLSGFGARHQGGDSRRAHHIDEGRAALRVHRNAPPVRPPRVARINNGAAQTRRREDSLVAEGGELAAAIGAIQRREAKSLLRLQRKRQQRRGVRGKGLRGRKQLAGRAGLRHRPLFHRIERRAALAVEQKQKTHLGNLRHAGPPAPHAGNLKQHRLRGHIVIPDIPVHRLKTPGHLPGAGRKRHHRTAVVIQAAADGVEEIRRGIAGGRKDQPARGVSRENGPHIRRARGKALRAGLLHPLALALAPTGRHGIPRPAQRAAARIVGAHHAARRIHAQVVLHQRANHHHIANDQGRRGDIVFPGGRFPQALAQCNAARHAKICAGRAGFGVQGDQLRIFRADENALCANAAIAPRIPPPGDAPAHQRIGAAQFARAQFGIEAPAQRAALGIQRHHMVEAGAKVERIVRDDGARLKGGAALCAAAVRHIAVAENPGGPEPGHILRRNLRERRKREALLAAAVIGPARHRPPRRGRPRPAGERPPQGGAGQRAHGS